MTLQVEMIYWKDHCSTGAGNGEWAKLETILDMSPIDVVTVGAVLKETDDYIIVASTLYDPDGEHSQCGYGELCLVKSDIKKRVKLTAADNV
jgi:hypothetical protein